MTSTKRLQGILVLKIIDHLTMAFFTAGKINLDSGRRLHCDKTNLLSRICHSLCVLPQKVDFHQGETLKR